MMRVCPACGHSCDDFEAFRFQANPAAANQGPIISFVFMGVG